MSNIRKILFALILFMCFVPSALAETIIAHDNIVNIYLFHSDSCGHCKKELILLDELEDKYDNIRIYKYEVSEEKNIKLLGEVTSLLGAKVTGVPFTIIGEKYYSGFSEENSKKKFMATIDYYSRYGYKDVVGEYIGDIELPSYEILEDAISIDEYIKDYGNYKFKLPIIGEINTKDLTLSVIAIVIGLIDGFNPCAMWVLLFLISMLIGMKDKKRMFVIGFTFLLTSALVYFLLMLLWLNISNLLIGVIWIRIIIGLFAIILGLFNFISTIRKKENGCSVVDDKKKNKTFDKIKAFIKEESLFLSLIGVITLAISVNIIELTCSAGLPLIFSEILSLNNLSNAMELLYIIIYILAFLFDDIVIFLIAMITLKLTGFSTKYGRISKILGGIILFIMGILLIFFPNIIMLNF